MTKHTRISKRSSRRMTLAFKSTQAYRFGVLRADIRRLGLFVTEGVQQLSQALAATAFKLPVSNSGARYIDKSEYATGWSGDRLIETSYVPPSVGGMYSVGVDPASLEGEIVIYDDLSKVQYNSDVYDDSAGYYSRPNDQPELEG